MTRAALVAAALLAVATGCTHRNDGGPSTAADGDGARRPSFPWQRSLALPAGPSEREFAIVAPDPATHAFSVRVRHPASAQLVVMLVTPYGHFGVFDSDIHPLGVTDDTACDRKRGARTCVMRFPRLAGERSGRWRVVVQKSSNRPAEVSVGFAFARVAARGRTPPLAGPLQATRRFGADGIALDFPRSWFVTTEPLSPSPNPAYRFAVSSVPIRRTPADEGPCLPGIAHQLPPDGVLVYLREALGADRRRSLSRMPDRPASFPLPPTSGGGLCGFDQGGGYWYPFRDRGRAFYLGVHIGPKASRGSRRAVSELLDGMEIRAR
jgi:hypothetical protein